MRSSIRQQLIVIICSLIVLAMTAVLLISHSVIMSDYEKKMQHTNSLMAENLAANISQFVQNSYNINNTIAEYPDLHKLDPAKQHELLLDITKRYPLFQLLAIHELNGQQTARSSGKLANRSERWWFKTFMAQQQPYISKTYYSVFSESPITTIVHGIYEGDRLTGVLMADIEVKKLLEMVENYNSSAGSYAYLLDGEGVVIAHPDRRQVTELYNYKTMTHQVLLRDYNGNMLRDYNGNELTEEMPFAISDSLQQIVIGALNGENGVGEYKDLKGEEYFCAYRTIALPGKSQPWSLIVVQQKNAVMAFVDYVTGKTMGIGLLVIIVSLLLTMWFSRKITEPIIAIVDATNKIIGGDLQVQVKVRSTTEVGVLANNFNRMVDEIREHRERMEDLVEARTMALGAANQEMLAMNEELTAMNQELIAMNEVLEETNNKLQAENEARQRSEENLMLRERQYRAITGLLVNTDDEAYDIQVAILNNAVQLLNAVAGYISIFDDEGKSFRIHYGIGIEESRIMETRPAEEGMQGEVYATGEMCLVEDYRVYPRRVTNKTLAGETTTVIMAPLKQGSKVKGVLAVSWVDEVHPVSEEDLESLRQFADLAAVALERDIVQQQITQMAYHDTLTGLPNRANLNAYLEMELAKGRAGIGAGVILFVDIDDFKSVNDNFGHSFGDNVIVAAGRHIQSALGDGSYVARIGGDEFVVIIPGPSDRKAAARIADRAIAGLCREYEVAAERLLLSASIGVVLYPADSDSAEDILKKADSAMYAAKKAGRNCWRFYEPSLLQEAYAKMKLTNGLRRGLERGELQLHYQPQYAAHGSEIVGFEALLRWSNSEYGAVSPSRFIPLAEQSGLIVLIGRWVLREACAFARQLADSGKDYLQVAVNISPRQLLSDDFVEVVQECIAEAGIQPCQLEFEITESVLIESMEDSVHKLRQLRDIGVMLSLDDFGTGYSSLTYLRSLPVSILKIDKSFIDMICKDETQLQVVGSIIQLGHTLGLVIVAEGVETQQQLEILIEHGCDRIQGYIYSKPLPSDEALALV